MTLNLDKNQEAFARKISLFSLSFRELSRPLKNRHSSDAQKIVSAVKIFRKIIVFHNALLFGADASARVEIIA